VELYRRELLAHGAGDVVGPLAIRIDLVAEGQEGVVAGLGGGQEAAAERAGRGLGDRAC